MRLLKKKEHALNQVTRLASSPRICDYVANVAPERNKLRHDVTTPQIEWKKAKQKRSPIGLRFRFEFSQQF